MPNHRTECTAYLSISALEVTLLQRQEQPDGGRVESTMTVDQVLSQHVVTAHLQGGGQHVAVVGVQLAVLLNQFSVVATTCIRGLNSRACH